VKFKMAENSLFAVLLRSPWWVSVAIAAGLALLAVALLPAEYRVVGAVSALPFVVIGAMAARRQWRLPSTAQVSHTLQAVGRMAWPEFARQLEEAFQRQGYTVERGNSAAVDFELQRQGGARWCARSAGSRHAWGWSRCARCRLRVRRPTRPTRCSSAWANSPTTRGPMRPGMASPCGSRPSWPRRCMCRARPGGVEPLRQAARHAPSSSPVRNGRTPCRVEVGVKRRPCAGA